MKKSVQKVKSPEEQVVDLAPGGMQEQSCACYQHVGSCEGTFFQTIRNQFESDKNSVG